MSDAIYTFKGKDITFAICIQIRAVINELQKRLDISFEDAMYLFYRSETYKTLQETENAFWAESAEYIADCYFGEGFLALAEAKNPCDVELVHKMKWETMTFNVFEMGTEEKVQRAFDVLRDGGVVLEGIHELPWNKYCATVIDRYGVCWWLAIYIGKSGIFND